MRVEKYIVKENIEVFEELFLKGDIMFASESEKEEVKVWEHDRKYLGYFVRDSFARNILPYLEIQN